MFRIVSKLIFTIVLNALANIFIKLDILKIEK